LYTRLRDLTLQFWDEIFDGALIDCCTAATSFYRNRGWVSLVTGFFYPGTEKPFVLMGLELST